MEGGPAWEQFFVSTPFYEVVKIGEIEMELESSSFSDKDRFVPCIIMHIYPCVCIEIFLIHYFCLHKSVVCAGCADFDRHSFYLIFC